MALDRIKKRLTMLIRPKVEHTSIRETLTGIGPELSQIYIYIEYGATFMATKVHKAGRGAFIKAVSPYGIKKKVY